MITFGGKKILEEDRLYCGCIAFYFALQVLNTVLQNWLIGNTFLAMIIRFGTYGCGALILLNIMGRKRNFFALLIAESFVSLVFLLSLLAGNIHESDWFDVYQTIAMTYIPLSIAAYSIKNYNLLMGYLYKVAIASVPILIAVAIFSYGSWETSYNMTLGYMMVFSALILLSQFTVDNKIYNIIIAVLLGTFILFIGSRGPFICIVAFFLIELLLSERYGKRKKAAIMILSIIALSVLWTNLDKTVLVVYQISRNLGFESRSIFLLMQGEAITHDSGRGAITGQYIQLIKNKPILGYGVMGQWIREGMYPHNIVLEFLMSFGIPLGMLLIGAIVAILTRAVKQKNNLYYNAMVILFTSYCFHLLVSGTFLKVWQFFVCIALCCHMRKPRVNQNKHSYYLRNYSYKNQS